MSEYREGDRRQCYIRRASVRDLPSDAYDDVVQHLQCIANFVITSVSFVDKECEWCIAVVNRTTTPEHVHTSFAARVVERRVALVIKNTFKDPTFDHHVLRHVFRCYMGCPIIPTGTDLCAGALCCVNDHRHDDVPAI